jgi:hypothetical protein
VYPNQSHSRFSTISFVLHIFVFEVFIVCTLLHFIKEFNVAVNTTLKNKH